MKKIIILSMILILGLSLMIFAKGALKVEFVQQTAAEIEGFVIVNRTPGGTTDATVQIQIWNAEPETEYRVRSCSTLIGAFETNKQGKGQAHFNLDDEEDLCCYMGIWTSPPPAMVKLLEAYICD